MTPTINNRKNSGEIQQINQYRNFYYWPLQIRGTIILFLSVAVIIAMAIVTVAWFESNPRVGPPEEEREILTGPRGGQYYINCNGNRTYVKRKGEK